MTWFEVFIPARDANAMNVTLTVEAPNWIGALRTGLSNIGEGQDAISNVMCDIKEDNSIHVTNPNTNRVFRLREVAGPPAEAAAPAPAPAPAAAAPKPISIPDAAPVAAPPAMKTEPAVAKVATADAEALTTEATALPARPAAPEVKTEPVLKPVAAAAAAAATTTAPAPAPVAKAAPAPAAKAAPAPAAKATPAPQKAPPPKRTTGQFNEAPKPVTREVTAPQPTDPQIAPLSRKQSKVNLNDVIADVFDATQDLLMDAKIDASRVANTLLDIAMQKVPADAGTFYLADINGNELVFEAVRGPKADAIKKSRLTVPVGQGVVGFCAQEGVCLVISDMQHDQRYFSAVADAVGYQPRDSLCASVEKDGRLYGAIQLINSKDGGFSADEMEVVRYIGLTAADMLERAADQKL